VDVEALRSALQHGDRPGLLLVHRQGATLFLTLERTPMWRRGLCRGEPMLRNQM
jgi:hypothetical protein